MQRPGRCERGRGKYLHAGVIGKKKQDRGEDDQYGNLLGQSIREKNEGE